MSASRSVSSSASNTVERLGDRQVRRSRRSCGPSPSPPGSAASSRWPWHAGHGRSERYGSSSSCSAQVPSSKRRRRFGRMPFELRRSAWPPNSSSSRCLSRQLRERRRRDRCRSRRGRAPCSASRTSFRSPSPTARSRRRPATSIRRARCAADRNRSSRPGPGSPVQAPCGELNENARGVISGTLMPHSTHASWRENSRSPPSSVLMTTMSSARLSATSTDSVSRRSMPPRTISRSTTTSMLWLRRRSSLMSSSSDRNWPSMRALVKPRVAQRRQLLLELALAAADDRRQHVDARVLRIEHHHVDDALERLAGDLAAAVRAVRHADVGEQQPQVVVDLGDGADRRSRIRAGGLLLDRNRRRQAVDQIDVRLLHLLEELPRVGRQRLDVAPLPFGVNRVEGERRLARPDRPVMTTSLSRGMSTSMFLRLWTRAPRTAIQS